MHNAPGINDMILKLYGNTPSLLTSGASLSVTGFSTLPSIIEYRAMPLRSAVLQSIGFLALRNTPGSSQSVSSLIISKSLNILTISLGS